MSSTDKTKLDNIATNADVSVNSDWAASSGKAEILNKPTIPDAYSKTESDGRYLQTETDPTVPTWAKAATKPGYTYEEITGKPALSTVATSGSYNDLSNKPTIPDAPMPILYLPVAAISGTGATRTIALSESNFIYTLSITDTSGTTLVFTATGIATDKRIVFRVEITTTVASASVTFPAGTWPWGDPAISDAGEYWFAVEGTYSGSEWTWTFEQVR